VRNPRSRAHSQSRGPAQNASAIDPIPADAFAAAFEALKDAGVPLVRSYRETKGKKRVPTGWALPEAWRQGTGIVFASAFHGYWKLVEHAGRL
jgi:hypothetical protein